MKNLYQTWTIGGPGYAVLQDKQIVENRRFNNDSVIEDDKIIEDIKPYANWVKLIHNVTDNSKPTEILYYDFNVSKIAEMVVDGEQITPVLEYQFDTIGEHTVYIKFVDMTQIPEYAFINTGLIEVTIPNLVTTIGDEAFRDCYDLAKITSLATTAPSVQNNTFYNIWNGVLYVPQGATGYDIWLNQFHNWTIQTISE